jgi:hypothetical protein
VLPGLAPALSAGESSGGAGNSSLLKHHSHATARPRGGPPTSATVHDREAERRRKVLLAAPEEAGDPDATGECAGERARSDVVRSVEENPCCLQTAIPSSAWGIRGG